MVDSAFWLGHYSHKKQRGHATCVLSGCSEENEQIGAVIYGYDPMFGIMHNDGEGAPAFVFDMMEPERPKVDRAVLAFLKSEALHPSDFTIRKDGVARLNPGVGAAYRRAAKRPNLAL